MILPLLSSSGDDPAKLGSFAAAVSMRLGPWLAPIAALSILLGVVGVWAGTVLIGRVWASRGTWGVEGRLRVPRADAVRIIVGTVIGAYGVVALVASVFFILASASVR